MEIRISEIGKIVSQYYNLGYFENDSLEVAIEKMKVDSNTTIGIALQSNEDKTEEK